MGSRPEPDDRKREYRPAYLVTARHVIEHVRKHAAPGNSRVRIRVNTKDGKPKWHDTPLPCWRTHGETAVDLAVLKIGIDDAWAHVAWPTEAFVIQGKMDDDDRTVELGDELFFAGLFWPHQGQKNNIPIVRTGNIAALRNEPVINRDGEPMDAYLVESRSIGGLSGSPVFIDVHTTKRTLQPTSGFMAAAFENRSLSRFRLLGVVHGHFEGLDVQPDVVADDGGEAIAVNMGIAMIIPGEHILAIVQQFCEEEEREAAEFRKQKQVLIVGDGAKVMSNVTYSVTTSQADPQG